MYIGKYGTFNTENIFSTSKIDGKESSVAHFLYFFFVSFLVDAEPATQSSQDFYIGSSTPLSNHLPDSTPCDTAEKALPEVHVKKSKKTKGSALLNIKNWHQKIEDFIPTCVCRLPELAFLGKAKKNTLKRRLRPAWPLKPRDSPNPQHSPLHSTLHGNPWTRESMSPRLENPYHRSLSENRCREKSRNGSQNVSTFQSFDVVVFVANNFKKFISHCAVASSKVV